MLVSRSHAHVQQKHGPPFLLGPTSPIPFTRLCTPCDDLPHYSLIWLCFHTHDEKVARSTGSTVLHSETTVMKMKVRWCVLRKAKANKEQQTHACMPECACVLANSIITEHLFSLNFDPKARVMPLVNRWLVESTPLPSKM